MNCSWESMLGNPGQKYSDPGALAAVLAEKLSGSSPRSVSQPPDPSLPAPEPSVNRATTSGLTLSDLPDTPLSACRSLWLRRRSGCCSARPARNHQ